MSLSTLHLNILFKVASTLASSSATPSIIDRIIFFNSFRSVDLSSMESATPSLSWSNPNNKHKEKPVAMVRPRHSSSFSFPPLLRKSVLGSGRRALQCSREKKDEDGFFCGCCGDIILLCTPLSLPSSFNFSMTSVSPLLSRLWMHFLQHGPKKALLRLFYLHSFCQSDS